MSFKIKFLLLSLALVFFCLACHNEGSSDQKYSEIDSYEEAFSDGDYYADQDAIRLEFSDALHAFEEDNHDVAAHYIDESISLIKEENINLSSDEKIMINNSIATLKKLANEVRTTKLESVTTLGDALIISEIITAKVYLIFTQVYAKDQTPFLTENALRMATERMENVMEQFENKVLLELEEMTKEVKLIVDQENFQSKHTAKAAKRLFENLNTWVASNANELGLTQKPS